MHPWRKSFLLKKSHNKIKFHKKKKEFHTRIQKGKNNLKELVESLVESLKLNAIRPNIY